MVLGPSGSGKSTLLQVIGELFKPDIGCTSVEKPIGIVFQNPGTQIFMPTVGSDVALKTGDVLRAKEALDRVGMANFWQHSARKLSGGQKQRVVVASALALQPRCLLFDEATASMDAE